MKKHTPLGIENGAKRKPFFLNRIGSQSTFFPFLI